MIIKIMMIYAQSTTFDEQSDPDNRLHFINFYAINVFLSSVTSRALLLYLISFQALIKETNNHFVITANIYLIIDSILLFIGHIFVLAKIHMLKNE